MKVVELKELPVDFSLFPKRIEGEDPVRTQGLHLTDIIRDIMEEAGLSKTASGSMWVEEKLNMAAEVGFMWEDVLSVAMKDRLPCRMGELVVDGVYMSPDGIEVDSEGPLLSEYKCVWSSSKRDPTDNYKWMCQVKGYCHGLGVRSVKMYILYLNGDWKGGGPEFRCFRIDFTDLEILENWEMITRHAKRKGWIK